MGFVDSSDIFQHVISSIFLDFSHVLWYLDDLIAIGSGSFEQHIEEVDKVLGRLAKKGFQVNPLKSFWDRDKVEYLGFVIARDGIQPKHSKTLGWENRQRIKTWMDFKNDESFNKMKQILC